MPRSSKNTISNTVRNYKKSDAVTCIAFFTVLTSQNARDHSASPVALYPASAITAATLS